MSASPDLLLEIRRLGGLLRVAAVDPESLQEVVLAVPAATPRAAILRLAHHKLARKAGLAARSLPVAQSSGFL